MKKNILTIFSAAASIILLSCFGNSGSNVASISNQPSSSNEVKIGNQVWMTENLGLDKFRNGDPISQAKTVEEWAKAGENKKPAWSWCHYDNNPANGEKYGKLYNWYAVNDPRGLAPKGWHIPSDDEWTQLTNYLGGKVAGSKMKSTSGWNDFLGMSGNGTNSSGFSGLPGGFRGSDGHFYGTGSDGNWWSTSEVSADNAWDRCLSSFNGNVIREFRSKHVGFSVRCLRD